MPAFKPVDCMPMPHVRYLWIIDDVDAKDREFDAPVCRHTGLLLLQQPIVSTCPQCRLPVSNKQCQDEHRQRCEVIAVKAWKSAGG